MTKALIGDLLWDDIYWKVNNAGDSLTCTTCHNDSSTYVPVSAYLAADPNLPGLTDNQSLCYLADPDMVSGASMTSASAPLISSLVSLPATSDAEAAPTGASASTQVDSLLSQLSPELQAQLSGVSGAMGRQQQLSAGTLSQNGLGIPDSALPATSISKMPLSFK